MAWVQIQGKRVWDSDIGRKYCKQCGEHIPRPKGWKKLHERIRAAWSCRRYCSDYCRFKQRWNKVEVIVRKRERRRTKEGRARYAEYQRRYRAKWRDKVNERRRLKRAQSKS